MNTCNPYKLLPGALVPWYQKNARILPWRQDKEPYHVWLSEIMLQQTRVEAVKGYYTRFLSALPSIEALANAQEDRLLKLWEGLGYYNRVRNLQKAARVIMTEHNGVFPNCYEDMLGLPGIGAYTAGAIASICFEQPRPAVDGNVLRVVSRVVESYDIIDDPKVKKGISNELERVYPKGACGDFTQSLMELGATVCVPNGTPLCGICPAASFCLAYLHGTHGDLPRRKQKKERRKEDITVFLLYHEQKLAVRRRLVPGVLHGMWELPNVPGILSKESAAIQAERWGVQPANLEQELKRKHIFTHIEWNMVGYQFQCDLPQTDFIWADKALLDEKISLPSAFRQFL